MRTTGHLGRQGEDQGAEDKLLTFLEVWPAHGEEEEKAIDDKAKLKACTMTGKEFDASYVWKSWVRF